MIQRRSFLGMAAAAAFGASGKKVPVGLELYSVRQELQKDLFGTVKTVAQMGYQTVEFFSSYADWKSDYAGDVRKLLDDVGVRCLSTHNRGTSFEGPALMRAIELNRVLGSKLIVMASAGKVEGIDGWKRVAETLEKAGETAKGAGMKVGFHNHASEWQPIDGVRPMDVLAKNTGSQVVLQLDVGTCVETGNDPVKWIEAHPGRIGSMHCKEWSKEQGFNAILGEGASPWKKIFAAAEKSGGIEDYLIEFEGTDQPVEKVRQCLANFRKLHA